MNKRKVIQLFIVLLILAGSGAFVWFKNFGNTSSISGFSVFENSANFPVDFTEGTLEKLEIKEGKIVLQEGASEGEYLSEIIDFGELVKLKDIELDAQNTSGKIFYLVAEDEKVYFSVNGRAWAEVRDEKKINKILNAKTKRDVVENIEADVEFYLRVCGAEFCEEEFSEIKDFNDVEFEGRYFQYRIVLKSDGGIPSVGNLQFRYFVVPMQNNEKIEESFSVVNEEGRVNDSKSEESLQGGGE